MSITPQFTRRAPHHNFLRLYPIKGRGQVSHKFFPLCLWFSLDTTFTVRAGENWFLNSGWKTRLLAIQVFKELMIDNTYMAVKVIEHFSSMILNFGESGTILDQQICT